MIGERRKEGVKGEERYVSDGTDGGMRKTFVNLPYNTVIFARQVKKEL